MLARAKSGGALVAAVIWHAIGLNIIAADQYIAIVLPSRMFRLEFKRRGYKPTVLSRIVEDSGHRHFRAHSVEHLWRLSHRSAGHFDFRVRPCFSFFNIINPILSLIYGFTGFHMDKYAPGEAPPVDEAVILPPIEEPRCSNQQDDERNTSGGRYRGTNSPQEAAEARRRSRSSATPRPATARAGTEPPGRTTESGLQRFLRQYKDLMQIVLLVAIISIVVLQDFATGIFIIGLTVLNAVLGLNQEGKRPRACGARKMLIIKRRRAATASWSNYRRRSWFRATSSPSRRRQGLRGRLLTAAALDIEEAGLTGESAPSPRTRRRRR